MATTTSIPIRVWQETQITIESNDDYLCAFDDDAAEIFHTRYTVLHKGPNYLTAYQEGTGSYVLYAMSVVDNAVGNASAQGRGGIGNPPPKKD